MSKEFKLPPIGEGVDAADVAEVLVSEGDDVELDQPVLELETEKAVVEVPCTIAGRVESVHVSDGDSISVGDVILTIAETADAEAEDDGSDDEAAGGDVAAEQAQSADTDEDEAEEAVEQDADDADAAAEESRAEDEDRDTEEQGTEEQGADEDAAEEAETIEFSLPPIGEGVEAADVADVLVSEGDEIEAETAVLELETEKAVVELPCPHAGRVTKLHVSAGKTVQVGDAILTIEAKAKQKSKPKQAKGKPSAAKSRGKAEKKESPKEKASQKKPSGREPAAAEQSAADASRGADSAEQGRMTEPALRTITETITHEGNGHPPVPAAPSTRRLARELGVALRDVEGSGRGGRVTQDDVRRYVKGRLEGGGSARGGELAVPAAGSLSPPPLPDFSSYGEFERQKLSKLARTAAENLTTSWNVIPHVTQHDRFDITDLETARKRFGQGAGKNGPKVTMTAIAMKALARCLEAFPKFNSSLDPETNELVIKRYVHIGCAVDTEYGLLVPVIKDCNHKSILQIAGELTDLAGKARDRKLAVSDMQGATCTVTNLGGIGGTQFTPIVNYPEVCILGMARGQKELRLIDGEPEERLLLPLSLSYDHRVINGADAARFLVALGRMMEDPFQLLSAI